MTSPPMLDIKKNTGDASTIHTEPSSRAIAEPISASNIASQSAQIIFQIVGLV
jgi:hypothetical protein